MIRLACVIGMLAAPVSAQQLALHCGARDEIVSRLATQYGEGRVAVGLAANGAMMETFANPETGSWTLMLTTPTGMPCVAAAGENYETVSEVVPSGFTL